MLKIKYHGEQLSCLCRYFTRCAFETGAAQWLSDQTFGVLGLKHLPIIATIALITLLIY